jgi:hypothetical protein
MASRRSCLVLLQVSKAIYFLADTVGPQHDRRFDVGVPIMSHLDVDLAPHIHLSPTYNEIARRKTSSPRQFKEEQCSRALNLHSLVSVANYL